MTLSLDDDLAAKSPRVRAATADDLDGIFAIYDPEVLHGIATFETVPRTPAQRLEWFALHAPEAHPLAVAEMPDGSIGGWASLSAWSPRPAYERSGESSVYVAANCRGRGLGLALLEELLERARRDTPVRVVLARIVLPNDASVRLHERVGFSPVGVLRRNGEKLGRILDVLLMDRHLDGGAARRPDLDSGSARSS